MILSVHQIVEFRDVVWQYYAKNERSMPWRENTSPYYILVSELMLQQTQVSRVIPKFDAFIERFPDLDSLAKASLSEVLSLWSGLGYNRRAKFLHLAAQKITQDSGSTPDTYEGLLELPGVGPNTAAAIMNYAYNQPIVFIETNIRSVFFHHFFHDVSELVDDKTLKQYVEATLDREHSREWFWALMDYGFHLKKNAAGRLQQSKHYKKQSSLKGSVREMRGWIVRSLTQQPQTISKLRRLTMADERFELAMADLEKEGLIESHGRIWSLTGHVLPS